MTSLPTLTPPKQKESTYIMADFVELLCLVNPDHLISMNDAITRVYHSVDYEVIRENELEENLINENEKFVGQFKDNQLKAGEDWFKNIEYRQDVFKGYYPFQAKNNCLHLKKNFSQKHKMYIFLLLCSNLRIVEKKALSSITTDFELLSAKALESYLHGFTVHNFGKSKAGRKNYSNKLAEAIKELSGNLRERNISEPNLIGGKNTGDGGLDIVAWKFPFNKDHAPSSLICFAQCSCSATEWVKKQAESHSNNWEHLIDFIHKPVNFMFIPMCFRDSLGNWFNKGDIRSSILMDRLRICFLLKNLDISYLNSRKALETVIRYRESVHS